MKMQQMMFLKNITKLKKKLVEMNAHQDEATVHKMLCGLGFPVETT